MSTERIEMAGEGIARWNMALLWGSESESDSYILKQRDGTNHGQIIYVGFERWIRHRVHGQISRRIRHRTHG